MDDETLLGPRRAPDSQDQYLEFVDAVALDRVRIAGGITPRPSPISRWPCKRR
jgi:hypothetical protein